MGGNQSVVAKVTNEVRNEFLNRADASCSAECNQTNSGNIIVIDGIAGNINITQKCEAESACVIKNSLDTAANSIIEALIRSDQDFQDSIISLSWNSQRTVAENRTLLSNKITNIMNASCTSETNQMLTDSIVYVSGIAGDVALTQEGSSKSTCTLDNIAKMVAYNDIVTDIDQGQTRKAAFGALMAAVGALIIFAVIMFIMMIMFTGVTGAVSSKSDKETMKTTGPTKSQAAIELATLAASSKK